MKQYKMKKIFFLIVTMFVSLHSFSASAAETFCSVANQETSAVTGSDCMGNAMYAAALCHNNNNGSSIAYCLAFFSFRKTQNRPDGAVVNLDVDGYCWNNGCHGTLSKFVRKNGGLIKEISVGF